MANRYIDPISNTENIDIGSASYKRKYKPGSKIGDLIGKYRDQLSSAPKFTKKLPYEEFAAPQREVFKTWEEQMARPEFERLTLNPFQRGWGAQAAAGGLSSLGSGQKMYQNTLEKTEQPYFNRLEQARDQYYSMIRDAYNRRLQKNYSSPTTFTNIR